MQNPLRRFPKTSRWIRRVVLALVAWEVLYVVCANLCLATHIVDKMVNAATPDVEMHVGSGWTIWPCYVHVKDVSIKVNDTDLQALLSVEEATAHVALYPFLDRKLLVYSAKATGLRYRMRHRVEAITDENRAIVAAYPEIPGAEPPVYDPVKREKPKPPKEKMWRFEVHDGEGDGNDFWIQEFHYHGPFRGTGGFFFWPLAEVTVYPIVGDAHDGTVSIADEDVTHDLKAHVEATVGRFTMPEQKGIEQLRGLDLHTTMSMTIPNGKFLKTLEAGGSLPHTTLSDAKLDAAVEFHQKHFTEGTKIEFVAKNVGVQEPFVRIDGPMQLSAIGKADGILEAGFDTLGLAVHVPALKSTEKSPWRLERTSVRANVKVEIDQPITASLAGMKGRFVIPDLAWITQLSNGKVHGDGAIVSELKADRNAKGTVNGSIETKLENLQFSAESLAAACTGTMTTKFATQVQVTGAPSATSLAELSLDLPAVTLRSGGRTKTTWVKATFPKATMKSAPLAFHTDGRVQVGDSSLLVVPVDDQAGPFAALAAKWLLTGNADLHGTFDLKGNAYAFTLTEGHVGTVEAAGLTKSGHGAGDKPQSAYFVKAKGFTAGIRLNGGAPSVTPLAGDDWLEKQKAEIP